MDEFKYILIDLKSLIKEYNKAKILINNAWKEKISQEIDKNFMKSLNFKEF